MDTAVAQRDTRRWMLQLAKVLDYIHDQVPLSLGIRSCVQGGYHVIRKEAGPLCRTSSSVRLWWEFKEPKGPKGKSLRSSYTGSYPQTLDLGTG